MKNILKDVRATLAIFWSIMCALYLGYILIAYGKEKEILTLVIGLIGGTILGGIMGVYFSANHSKQPPITTTTDVSVGSVITETKTP